MFSLYFYPRSPCGERHFDTLSALAPEQFLSTLSLRRATNQLGKSNKPAEHFYPRSPCGERPQSPARVTPAASRRFLSTLSLRRATLPSEISGNQHKHFYPRSPCGERLFDRGPRAIHNAFLSTLSLRRATTKPQLTGVNVGFLSTLSLRRATPQKPDTLPGWAISIHALLAESDNL